MSTVISWTNQDNTPHTVTHGVSPDVDFNPVFQSGNFFKGQEFFNTFNHPNFDFPNRDFGTRNFGKIFTAQFSRQIQFGLKLVF